MNMQKTYLPWFTCNSQHLPCIWQMTGANFIPCIYHFFKNMGFIISSANKISPKTLILLRHNASF